MQIRLPTCQHSGHDACCCVAGAFHEQHALHTTCANWKMPICSSRSSSAKAATSDSSQIYGTWRYPKHSTSALLPNSEPHLHLGTSLCHHVS